MVTALYWIYSGANKSSASKELGLQARLALGACFVSTGMSGDDADLEKGSWWISRPATGLRPWVTSSWNCPRTSYLCFHCTLSSSGKSATVHVWASLIPPVPLEFKVRKSRFGDTVKQPLIWSVRQKCRLELWQVSGREAAVFLRRAVPRRHSPGSRLRPNWAPMQWLTQVWCGGITREAYEDAASRASSWGILG